MSLPRAYHSRSLDSRGARHARLAIQPDHLTVARAHDGAERAARTGTGPGMTRLPTLVATALAALLGLAGCAGMVPEEAPAPAPAEEEEAEPAPAEEPERPVRRPEDTAEAAAEEAPEPRRGLSGDDLYRLLVADLAGRRGDVESALQGYLETARATRDPRIAERATRLALYAERDDAALEAGQRWVELAPGNREAHSVLARLRLRRGEAEAAVGHLQRLIELTDGGAGAGMQEVAALVGASGNPEAALTAMATLVERYPDLAVSHYALADLAAGTGDHQAALVAVDRALELQRDYAEAHVLRSRVLVEMGRTEEALSLLRTAGRRYPDDRTLAVGYPRLLLQAGRAGPAQQEMQRVFERFGDDARAVYSLALLAMQAETWDDAQIYLERLLAMDARASVAHYYLGRILQQEGDCTAALRHYIKVGGGEHRFDAGLRTAVCMAELGRMEEARLHLERMRARYDQSDSRTRLVMTRARVERIAGNDERALEVLARALERSPDNVDLRYARALAAADLDRFERARSDLEAILDQEPDNARALNALGYMLADRGLELQHARRLIERALEQNPDDPATIDSMGWVLYRMSQPRRALTYLERAWELEPDPEVGAHLGEVLWTLGRYEEANAIWEAAREQAPDNEVLRETMQRLSR